MDSINKLAKICLTCHWEIGNFQTAMMYYFTCDREANLEKNDNALCTKGVKQ